MKEQTGPGEQNWVPTTGGHVAARQATLTAQFIRLMTHRMKFRLYLFARIPSAYFSGIRIREMDETRCEVSVPYRWFSQNPFRSTYFACLSMAAEMSTGALAMAHIYKHDPPYRCWS